MNGRRSWQWSVLLWAVVLAGCSKGAQTTGEPECAVQHPCGSTTPAPASEIPPVHRSAAQACGATPASANVGSASYDVTGRACTSDNQCTAASGFPGHCLHGACTIDECLTDDDCADGGVCVCSSPLPDSARVNLNTCVRGNCRVDGDCGANGYCSPSAGICGVNGFYCHTAADTCVDPTLDCGSSCMQDCTYFPDKQRFACSSIVCGGC
jgi:hypothetical protein